jgi:hypothetical protein
MYLSGLSAPASHDFYTLGCCFGDHDWEVSIEGAYAISICILSIHGKKIATARTTHSTPAAGTEV